MESPIVQAVLALLAIPGVTSALVVLIRGLSDQVGIAPRVTVYGVSLVLVGIIGAMGGIDPIPAFTGDPTTYVAAWLTWAGLVGAMAESIYRTLKPKLVPDN